MKISAPQKRVLSRIGLILTPIAIVASIVIPSCKDQKPSTSNIVLPDSNLSYSRDIDPLFTQTCLGSQCHNGTAPAKGLDLDPPSYLSVINHVPTLVVPGDTVNSLLLERLDGRLPPIMPSNQYPLTSNQIHAVKQWIKEGARHN